ncbi:hypothetical protein G7Y89_g13666 [Cudoniella acicularis]|uniref:F-box domain-containing protein n=1 Tax=Cudoniella acicularis TaxID=354080 RepID=A0A8H4R939_9HELO|nr:hypothetical protein G7Y89_g13666 [Cudoniella acicularis]
MALDAQSNWNVEMSQPLKIPIRQRDKHSDKLFSQEFSAEITFMRPPAREILLPSEIITQILSYIPLQKASQSTFWSCALVSRTWYSCSIAFLYVHPHLDGGNFADFVRTICPSKNAHIRQSSLSVLVKRLDMSELVHNSSRSLTARILGRLKGNIEGFVAPQASFGINSFAALSKCTKLRVLDLSLISASISNRLLFQTLKSLQELEILFFPRSSSLDGTGGETPYTWPPKLKALHLAGGISDHFLETHLVYAPQTLTKFSIQHCSQVHQDSLIKGLKILGPYLKHLTIRHPMSQLAQGSLDVVLEHCPSLIALRVSADYLTHDAFDSGSSNGHPLQILDLECSPTFSTEMAPNAWSLCDLVDKDILPDLRIIRVSSRLRWGATDRSKEKVEDLEELLEENEAIKPLGLLTGVWEID